MKKHLKNEFELFNSEGIVYCDQVIVYFGLEFQLNRFYCTKIVIAISATSFCQCLKCIKIYRLYLFSLNYLYSHKAATLTSLMDEENGNNYLPQLVKSTINP